ncbi:unnamed protein product [Moneuplotes crassus]|uniref:Uncharacterized protein n=1 Tax=Euplotes crassus TaxID=5936 RepID=A0AAD1UDZ6_EUPCR|nr:unnamed protein product [Moneuplotes crassus]
MKKKTDTNTRLADLKKKINNCFGQKSIRLNKTPQQVSRRTDRASPTKWYDSHKRNTQVKKSQIFPNVKESEKLQSRRIAEELSQTRYQEYKNYQNFSTIKPLKKEITQVFPENPLTNSVHRPNIKFKLRTSEGLSMDTIYSQFATSHASQISLKSREDRNSVSNKFSSLNQRKSSSCSSNTRDDFEREDTKNEALPSIQSQGEFLLGSQHKAKSRMKSQEKLTLAHMIKVKVFSTGDESGQSKFLKDISNPKSYDNLHPISMQKEYERYYFKKEPYKSHVRHKSTNQDHKILPKDNNSPERNFSHISRNHIQIPEKPKISKYEKAKRMLKMTGTTSLRYREAKKNIIKVTDKHVKKKRNNSYMTQEKNDEKSKTGAKSNTKSHEYPDDTRELLRHIKSQKSVNPEQIKLKNLLRKIDKADRVNSKVYFPSDIPLMASLEKERKNSQISNRKSFAYQQKINIFEDIQ